MAGAGYKLFNTGDVLTAQQVNEYLMQQTVMSFADAAARTTALSGVLAEGMVSYLRDTNVVEIYTGASWVSLDDPNAIQNTLLTTTGDTIYASGASTPARLGIGSTGQVLTVAGGVPSWASPSTGSLTLISTTNLSTATTTLSSIPQTYTNLRIIVQGATITTGVSSLQITFNNNTGGDYHSWIVFAGGSSATTLIRSGTGNNYVDSSTRNAQRSFLVDLSEYTNTTYGKNFIVYANNNEGGNNNPQIQGGTYASTSAISSIEIKTSASTFSGGRVLLYGVK